MLIFKEAKIFFFNYHFINRNSSIKSSKSLNRKMDDESMKKFSGSNVMQKENVLPSTNLIDELQMQIKLGTLFRKKSNRSSTSSSPNKVYAPDEETKSTKVNFIASSEQMYAVEVVQHKIAEVKSASQTSISSQEIPEWKRQLLERKMMKLGQNNI